MFFLQIYSTKLMKNVEFFEFAESPVLGRAGSAAFIRHGAVNRSELNDSRFFKTAARIGRNLEISLNFLKKEPLLGEKVLFVDNF